MGIVASAGTMKKILCAVITVVGLVLPNAASAQHHEPQSRSTGGDHQRHMEHRFDDPERYAESFDDPSRDEWQMPSRVIETLNIQPAWSVADIGAGTGYFTVRLARSLDTSTVYAIDVEPSMTEWIQNRVDAERLTNVVTVLGASNGTHLPEPVDLVLIVDTYHHIPDRVAYFAQLKHDLKPSGRLAIIDFRKDSPSGPPVEFRFTPDQIIGELAEAGFTLQAQHDFLPRQMFLVFAVER